MFRLAYLSSIEYTTSGHHNGLGKIIHYAVWLRLCTWMKLKGRDSSLCAFTVMKRPFGTTPIVSISSRRQDTNSFSENRGCVSMIANTSTFISLLITPARILREVSIWKKGVLTSNGAGSM